MAAIPAVLIPALRVALVDQGFPSATIRDDGTVNAAGFLAGAYDTIEIRTDIAPTITIRTADLLKQGQGPSPIVSLLKPTIVLTGNGQQTVIAPVGASAGSSGLPLVAALLALIGIGFALGRWTD